MSRDTWSGFGSLPQTLNRRTYVHNNPTLLTDPSGRCFGPLIFLAPICISAAIGVGSYIVSTVISNVVQNVGDDRAPSTDVLRGLNPADAAISAAAGAVGGPIGGIAYGPTRILAGAALGCASTFASQAIGGRPHDLAETAIGCAAGGAGSVLKLATDAGSFVYGSIVALAQGLGTLAEQTAGSKVKYR